MNDTPKIVHLKTASDTPQDDIDIMWRDLKALRPKTVLVLGYGEEGQLVCGSTMRDNAEMITLMRRFEMILLLAELPDGL